MPTPAEEAFAESFGALVEVHSGEKLWTFGGASFAGVASNLRADDPRFAPGPGRQLELIVSASALPSGIKQGSYLTFDGVRHTVAQPPSLNQGTGLYAVLLSVV